MNEHEIPKSPDLQIPGGDAEAEPVHVGACCACGVTTTLRNVMFLDQKAPVAGKGWGCVVCDLPLDGAIALLCDECVANGREPIEALAGDVESGLRVPVEQLRGEHRHDLVVHCHHDVWQVLESYGPEVASDAMDRILQELMASQFRPPRRCRVCGCTDADACAGGCTWVEHDLCSSCAGQPNHRRP